MRNLILKFDNNTDACYCFVNLYSHFIAFIITFRLYNRHVMLEWEKRTKFISFYFPFSTYNVGLHLDDEIMAYRARNQLLIIIIVIVCRRRMKSESYCMKRSIFRQSTYHTRRHPHMVRHSVQFHFHYQKMMKSNEAKF